MEWTVRRSRSPAMLPDPRKAASREPTAVMLESPMSEMTRCISPRVSVEMA
jgi:hypothetical protein